MATRSGVAHTTISIPFDLKRRMDQVAQCVDWSDVACRAFESWLDEAASEGRAIGARSSAVQSAKLPSHVLWAAAGAIGMCLLLISARRRPSNPLGVPEFRRIGLLFPTPPTEH